MSNKPELTNRLTQEEMSIMEGYLYQDDRRLNCADAMRLLHALVEAYEFIDARCEYSGVEVKE